MDDEGILCEGCGYPLNGLPETGRCPECGRAIRESLGGHRHPTPFDMQPSIGAFLRTTRAVLFRPSWFYGTLATRYGSDQARVFARRHRGFAAAFFALAAAGHVCVSDPLKAMVRGSILDLDEPVLFSVLVAPFALINYVLLTTVIYLAVELIVWMGARRGIRVPLPVVRRGLCFHAACYVPVAIVAAATICGYITLIDWGVLDPARYWASIWPGYGYILIAEAIVGSGYLVITGWIGFRSIKYANR